MTPLADPVARLRELADEVAEDARMYPGGPCLNDAANGHQLEGWADRIRDIASSIEGQWLPIESAPQDGSTVLIYGGTFDVYDHENLECNAVCMAFYDKRHKHWHGDEANAHDVFRIHRPTHWMPLPTPPAARTAAQEDRT